MNPYPLYLVTDDRQDLDTFCHVVEQVAKGGVTMIQVREKHGDVRAFIERAARAKSILEGTNIPLIINDRVDVALAVDADGVHLGQSDMPAEIARKLIGDNKILGLSVENEAQLEEAKSLPVDYLGVSAIFSTPTKTDIKREWGIDGLAYAVRTSPFPTVAIGGINHTNLSDVLGTGVNGIALVSAICQAEDPKSASKSLLKSIKLCQNQ
ncbi:putative Thiamine-phosphate pyrophosphorylase [Vibrio nigripulchritudo SFn27]|uniref:Thiamine-phosphate synthase n=1 Tax=Vibrio nigripulchritudo TaxID=28173 RepID=U4K4B6_9VIBR|nr:thiamine phosphate synthase [Vibrio nigripulchritudo]CCN85758.1 putative Thiamine-phosphate pyrophosphorylase [Vibrio nigripulchritudo BLFn1]CCN86736.1 putative Thiamine-phosphate pyrophosphorylase [Vibrio nigripulchritudo SFn27]CCN96022.1 putative Thiamine-phosphate pyrophosphorylase [Vibrio nigripulchritudo ENn2]CCO43353.1 putative Thiamine-phosphate pyrophosphorylase [Vibrio nigripulchritudo SFn135]CCO53652.1 putative Thiamine-phosphate pyrophosphorylase [Vibrio nigripulchritudo Wn13]